MNSKKTGSLIRGLRLEQGMTQKQLAEQLQVSDRAVSKWERGVGSPDVSLLSALSVVLGVDVQSLLNGSLDSHDSDGGNMKRMKFYRCACCGNILTSTTEADISCCGKVLAPLEAQCAEDMHEMQIEEVEDEYLVSLDHPMTKEHHIAFLAYANDERVVFVRQYPEQAAQTRFARIPRGTWYACCTNHGLFAIKTRPLR